MQRYSQTVFESLVAITGYDQDMLSDYVRVESDGVYPADCLDILPPTWRWKPRHALIGRPGVTSAGPALPFDFSATDLACFLLTHSAAFLIEVWGEPETGPQDLLEAHKYGDAADAAIVLKQAYALLQGAISVIGTPSAAPFEAANNAHAAFTQAWDDALERYAVMDPRLPEQDKRERHVQATAQVETLKTAKHQLEMVADAHLEEWRNAITRYLQGYKTPALSPEASRLAQPTTRWSLQKDSRPRELSYLDSLRLTMQALLGQGVKPTAMIVLECWRAQKPKKIVEVKAQSFTFCSATGITKTVTRKELQNTIDRQLIKVGQP